MNDRFVVKTTLSKADTLALAKQQLGKNKIFTGVCSLLLIVGAVVNWVRGGEYKILISIAALVLLLGSLFLDKLVGSLMYKNANKVVGETTYTITNADVYMRCEVREGGIPFDAFTDLVETNDRFFLYIQKRAAFILPKKDFIEGDLNEFTKFMVKKTAMEFRRVRG